MKAISSILLTQRRQSPRHSGRFGVPAVVAHRFLNFDRGGGVHYSFLLRKSRTCTAGISIRNGQQQSSSFSSFHFASSEYERCFQDLPKPDVAFLKESSVAFLDAFDQQGWYDDPVSRRCGTVYDN